MGLQELLRKCKYQLKAFPGDPRWTWAWAILMLQFHQGQESFPRGSCWPLPGMGRHCGHPGRESEQQRGRRRPHKVTKNTMPMRCTWHPPATSWWAEENLKGFWNSWDSAREKSQGNHIFWLFLVHCLTPRQDGWDKQVIQPLRQTLSHSLDHVPRHWARQPTQVSSSELPPASPDRPSSTHGIREARRSSKAHGRVTVLFRVC